MAFKTGDKVLCKKTLYSSKLINLVGFIIKNEQFGWIKVRKISTVEIYDVKLEDLILFDSLTKVEKEIYEISLV